MNNISATTRWAKNLTVEKIAYLSEEEMLPYIMERPGHPGVYGFKMPMHEFDSEDQFTQIMYALMLRMGQIENLQEKMEARK